MLENNSRDREGVPFSSNLNMNPFIGMKRKRDECMYVQLFEITVMQYMVACILLNLHERKASSRFNSFFSNDLLNTKTEERGMYFPLVRLQFLSLFFTKYMYFTSHLSYVRIGSGLRFHPPNSKLKI